jgi:hypothetical protein
MKPDDHDRKKKGDLRITYRGREFKVECKSLQTNTIEKTKTGFNARYQCDASDRRRVTFSDGSHVETTCLLIGEFDIIAVNLFAFEEKWRFAFALNRDLPRSQFKKYTKLQQRELLSSLMPISLPLKRPYVSNPCVLLDRIIDGA